MLGDCLERMKEIPDGSVDMILADPPYGTTACKWDSVIPFEPMWEQINRVIKKNGAIVLFGQEPFSSVLRVSNLKMFKYDWVWEKERGTGFGNAKKQPLRCFEMISVFYSKKCNYYPVMKKLEKPYYHVLPKYDSEQMQGGFRSFNDTVRVTKEYTHSYPKNIIKISRGNTRSLLHPTQKPVELMEYLIKTYTQEGETVLDFAAGSMSTAVACINTNRKGIMVEKDPHYFKVGSERVGRALSEKDLK
jgi:site-specific DNA-methyltransferase (adenine-specific)